MSLVDILQIERERARRERVVLHTIYERMQNRINNAVRAKARECVYTIPEFIPGYPLIDPYRTMSYLVKKLKKEGFIVVALSQLELYITWNPEELRKVAERLREHEQKTVADKELERRSDDFINSLIVSKRDDAW